MKYAKVIILILLTTALIQFLYFDIENCDQCDFDGMSMEKFFTKYTQKCLTVVRVELLDNLSFVNWTEKVEPLQYKENLTFKTEKVENG